MYHHAIFGGHLASELPFPELPLTDTADPDWTLRIHPAHESPGASDLIGEDTISGVGVRLWWHAAGLRLEFDDTGSFEISPDGATVAWHPIPNADINVVRADVMARVLAISLHIAGKLCLHGSAVALEGAGLAFVAPKRHGKSTLAMALVRAGGRLVTDDTLAVDCAAAIVSPGVQNLRLWKDASDSLRAEELPARLGRAGQKGLLTDLPKSMLALEPVGLSVIYNVRPVEPSASRPAASRIRLPPVAAALSVLQHSRLGSLLGGREAPIVFQRAAALARTVPVYSLEVARSWDRLPEVVDTLAGWHDFNPTPLLDAVGSQ